MHKNDYVICERPLKGAGGLHQDFLEIDFLVVSDREEYRVTAIRNFSPN